MKEAKNDWTEFNTTEPTELAEMTDKIHLKKVRQFYEMYPLSGLVLTVLWWWQQTGAYPKDLSSSSIAS